jgi:hypothetical protein
VALSIDTYDDVSVEVFAGKSLQLHILWLSLTTKRMPRAISFAIGMAKRQLKDFRNRRNTARWVALIYEIRNLWSQRQEKPEIRLAEELFRQSWRLLSSWPIRPHFLGEPVFSARLGKRQDSEKGYMTAEFVWSVDEDARPVPINHVYDLLNLPQANAGEQELAWKVCFWLSFLSESELQSLAEAECGRKL